MSRELSNYKFTKKNKIKVIQDKLLLYILEKENILDKLKKYINMELALYMIRIKI